MIRKLMSLVILALLLSLVGSAYGDLVARWRFDEGEGTTAYDATGSGHDAEIYGDPAWVTGMYGLALDLDGSNDYAQTDNLEGLPVGTEPGSLTAWARTDSVGSGWAWIISYGNSGTNNARFLGRNGSTFYIGGYGNDISHAGFWEIGEWHHVAQTFDGTTAIAYGDGVEVAREDKAWNTQEVTLMMGQQISPAGEMWSGAIDDVRVYDHVLTVDELQLVMANQGVEASQPNPGDNETDVLRDTTSISWGSGVDATAHDVYFGTDLDAVSSADRANPMGVLVSQNQTETTYPMDGILPYGQTYYWRIDEVQTDGTIIQGYVWAFTVETELYPVQNVTATSNTTSSSPEQGPERLVDGSGIDDEDQHSTDTDQMWAGNPNPTEPSYLLFEFDGMYKLVEMLIWNYNMQFEAFLGYGIKDVTLEYSLDGTDWTVLGDFELAQAPGMTPTPSNSTVPLDGVAAKYVRMTINSNFSNSDAVYGCSEIRFMSVPVQPTQPDPADGDTGVSLGTTLSWRPGREATSHEIYVGTDPNALTLAGTTTQASFMPDDLELETTHYWQVVEVNEAEAISSWAGDVWTFAVEEYAVIDDFESYIDDETAGDVIWEVWIDGLVEFGGDAANGGSQVGHNTSPFAEQSIAHSGSQSMPLYFDNGSASAISEADMALTPAQDWTGNGVESLVLWFFGATGNTGQPYVKINETKVPYDGPATDIGTPGWHKWNIVLADSGANLSNVTSVSIGVEGNGSGVIYIDDIRLYPKVFEKSLTSNIDIAISTQANWWSQAAADREMEEIVDNAQAPIALFNAGDQDGLADWLIDHTNNGVANLLILCGQLPDTIYEPGNARPDDSLVEQFLDGGNTIINTGDWIFFVVNGGGSNGAAGLQTIMDITGVTMGNMDVDEMTVTADGQTLTPTLQDFMTDRGFVLDTLEGDWSTELILAQNADGTIADPVIVRNSATGGRIGIFYQVANEDDRPRGEVITEWINNWYLDAAN